MKLETNQLIYSSRLINWDKRTGYMEEWLSKNNTLPIFCYKIVGNIGWRKSLINKCFENKNVERIGEILITSYEDYAVELHYSRNVRGKIQKAIEHLIANNIITMRVCGKNRFLKINYSFRFNAIQKDNSSTECS